MLNELAHLGLTVALVVAVLGAVIPLVAARLNYLYWMRLAPVLSVLQFLLVAFAFVILTLAFIRSDFSLSVVLLNSHTHSNRRFIRLQVFGETMRGLYFCGC